MSSIGFFVQGTGWRLEHEQVTQCEVAAASCTAEGQPGREEREQGG